MGRGRCGRLVQLRRHRSRDACVAVVASSGARIAPKFASASNACRAFLHNLQCPERRLAGHLFAPVVNHKRDSHVPRGFFIFAHLTNNACFHAFRPSKRRLAGHLRNVAWPDTCGRILDRRLAGHLRTHLDCRVPGVSTVHTDTSVKRRLYSCLQGFEFPLVS